MKKDILKSSVGEVIWSDLTKPNEYGYFSITLIFYPAKNEADKKFMSELKGVANKMLTGEKPHPPYWQNEADKESGGYRVRFSTKFEVKEWRDKVGDEINQPQLVLRGTKMRVKYVALPGNGGNFLNLYLNGCQIMEAPEQAEPPKKSSGGKRSSPPRQAPPEAAPEASEEPFDDDDVPF